MSDHGWPGWPDDDPFDAHDPGGADPLGADPLGHDPGAGGDDGGLFHEGLFPGGPDADGAQPVAGDGWDDGDEPGHGAGGGDAPAAGYDDWHDALSDIHHTTDDTGTDDTAPDDGARLWADDTGHGMGPVGADPDAMPDAADAGVFPSAVDVGPLPEPVDGFPWIDTGSLGVVPVDAAGDAPDVSPPDSAGLAEYAAADLPPGVDPWAELAASDDPATSALAEFWRPEQ